MLKYDVSSILFFHYKIFSSFEELNGNVNLTCNNEM